MGKIYMLYNIKWLIYYMRYPFTYWGLISTEYKSK